MLAKHHFCLPTGVCYCAAFCFVCDGCCFPPDVMADGEEPPAQKKQKAAPGKTHTAKHPKEELHSPLGGLSLMGSKTLLQSCLSPPPLALTPHPNRRWAWSRLGAHTFNSSIAPALCRGHSGICPRLVSCPLCVCISLIRHTTQVALHQEDSLCQFVFD